jgi:hypothetical protein
VALVRTYVSEGGIASIIRVTRIGKLGTTLAVISNRSTLRGSAISSKRPWSLVIAKVAPGSLILFSLMMEPKCSSETLVLTRAAWYHMPEDNILHNLLS